MRVLGSNGTVEFTGNSSPKENAMNKANRTRRPALTALLVATTLLAFVAACSSDSEPEGLSAPTNLTATAVSENRIDLTWSGTYTRTAAKGVSRAATYESGFRVERSATSATSGFALAVVTEGTTFSDTSVSASTQYWYRVRAFDQEGPSDWSSVGTATTPASLFATP